MAQRGKKKNCSPPLVTHDAAEKLVGFVAEFSLEPLFRFLHRIGRSRYRRTKILSWILSVLLLDTKDEKGRPVRFGSVGGGGRYDGLVSRFRGEPVPAMARGRAGRDDLVLPRGIADAAARGAGVGGRVLVHALVIATSVPISRY